MSPKKCAGVLTSEPVNVTFSGSSHSRTPPKEAARPMWVWDSSLQDGEDENVCGSSRSVCGTRFQQPQEAMTEGPREGQGGRSLSDQQDGARLLCAPHGIGELAENMNPRTLLTWVSSSVTSKFSLFKCLFTNVMRDCEGKDTGAVSERGHSSAPIRRDGPDPDPGHHQLGRCSHHVQCLLK